MLSIEKYDHKMMLGIRHNEVTKAEKLMKRVGIVMGTLGRQGSPHILKVIYTFTYYKDANFICK